MMEMSPLPRLQPSEAKPVESSVVKETGQSAENSDFDQHLNQQIERAEVAETTDNAPAQSVESEENQQDKQQAGQVATEAEGEQATQDKVAEPGVVITEEDTLNIETEQLTAEPDTVLVEQKPVVTDQKAPLTEAKIDQPLPLDGKALPPLNEAGKVVNIAPGQQVAAESKTVAQVVAPSSDRVVQQQSNIQQQVLNTETKPQIEESAEFVAPELKLQQKNVATNNNQVVTAKTSLNMASATIAASNLQQVPLTTSVSAAHIQTNTMPLTESIFTTTPTMSSTLSTPLQNPAWSQGVAERVAWMVQGNFQSAELKLNPANLGPLEIKLAIKEDQASVTFITNHAPVREALDAAMPRLRDMLESQGITLADVDVSDAGVHGEQADKSSGDGDSGQASVVDEEGQETLVHESVVQVNSGDGVSIYA